MKAVAFDVIETLFNTQPLEKKLNAADLPTNSLEVWFARVLRDAFALEVVGEYKSFAEVASGTLASLLREHQLEPERSTIDGVVKSFAELPAHPDVRSAFEALHAAKLPIVPVTTAARKQPGKCFRTRSWTNSSSATLASTR
jgi:2-haloacid dehalogenase